MAPLDFDPSQVRTRPTLVQSNLAIGGRTALRVGRGVTVAVFTDPPAAADADGDALGAAEAGAAAGDAEAPGGGDSVGSPVAGGSDGLGVGDPRGTPPSIDAGGRPVSPRTPPCSSRPGSVLAPTANTTAAAIAVIAMATRRRRRLRRSGQLSVSTVGRTGASASGPPTASAGVDCDGRFAPRTPIRYASSSSMASGGGGTKTARAVGAYPAVMAAVRAAAAGASPRLMAGSSRSAAPTV